MNETLETSLSIAGFIGGISLIWISFWGLLYAKRSFDDEQRRLDYFPDGKPKEEKTVENYSE